MLDQLSRPFPPQHVKTRQQAGQTLYYVSIDDVIARFNEVLGMDWSSEIKDVTIVDHGTDTKGRTTYMATAHVAIHVRNSDGTVTTREGVGAATGIFEDPCIKTALAAATSKAGNYFGIASELWSPARRAFCARMAGHERMDPATLRVRLSSAVQQWRNEDATLSSFGSKQELNHAFLEAAALSPSEIEDIRERCMEGLTSEATSAR